MYYNTTLVKGLDKSQFDVHVACLSDNNVQYAKELEMLGIAATPFEMNRYSIDPTSDMRLARQLVKFVRDEKFDVIIGHGSKAGFLVRLVQRLTGVPAISALTSLSIEPRIHGNKARVYRGLEKIGAGLGGHVVNVAHSTREVMIKEKIITEDRISTIHTGIDLEKFHGYNDDETQRSARLALGLDPNRPVVGWAARLSRQKAPKDFVDVAAKVIEKVPQVQVYMAGDGELAAETDAKIRELGITENLIRAPWQSDVPRMLQAFDIFVLNSYWEGLPLSVLEAMAMGCATVASAVDGTVEILVDHVKDIDKENGRYGFLAPAGDIEKTAAYIIQLLKDDDLRKEIADAGKTRIREKFHLEGMIEEWENLLRQQAQRGKSK